MYEGRLVAHASVRDRTLGDILPARAVDEEVADLA